MRTRVLSLVTLLCLCCSVRAQGVSMLENTPGWYYFIGIWNLDSPGSFMHDSSHEFYIDGIEEIDGKTYQRLYISVHHLDGGNSMMRSPGYSWDDMDNEYLVGMREESGRVYVNEAEYMDFLRGTGRKGTLGNPDYVPYERTDDGEFVLYDFTMKEGDKFRSVEGYPDVWVAEVKDTVLEDGVTRKMQTLSNGLVLIEGIGCVYSSGMMPAYLNPKPTDDEYANVFAGLTGFSSNGTLIYSKGRDEQWPFYLAGIEPTVMPRKDINIHNGHESIYDLTGRRVLNPQPGHLYIQSSKKTIYSK